MRQGVTLFRFTTHLLVSLLLLVVCTNLQGFAGDKQNKKKGVLTAIPLPGSAVSVSTKTDNPESSILEILTGASTSGNSRAPQGLFRYERSAWLVTAAEMAAAGFPSGADVNLIGFKYSVAQSITTTGGFIVYMENTSDATFTRGTTWSTIVSTMTVVHNNPITIPAAVGTFDIPFVGGSSFTYTGGGVYMAFEYQNPSDPLSTANTALCNTALTNGLVGAQSNTALPTTVAASSFRPYLRLGTSLDDIIQVPLIYTLGKIPIPIGNPDNINVLVSNVSASPATFDLTVTVKKASDGTPRFTSTQNVAAMAAGTSQVVSFPGWSPTIAEDDSIIAETSAISGEGVTSNNRHGMVQNVNVNTFSYSQGPTPSGGVGFTGATGDFVAKFTTNSTGGINQIQVNFSAGGQPYNVGIWDATGAGGTPGTNLFTSPSLTSAVGVATILVTPAVNVNGDFYVGVMQTGTTNVSFSFQNENPIRATTFYYTSPTGSSTWTDFSPGSPFRFMIEPKLALGNDVGASIINSPVGVVSIPSPTIAPKATIANFGTSANTFDATLNITGAVSYTSTKSVVNLAVGESRIVTFDSTFTPVLSCSPYTVKVYTSLAGDQNTGNDTISTTFTAANPNYGGGCPINGGYYFANSTSGASGAPTQPAYSWIDPVSSGHTAAVFADPDDGSVTVPMGLTFNYYGTPFTNVNIFTNGFLTFGTAGTAAVYGVTTIPAAANPANLIAGCLIDLDLTAASYPTAQVYYGGDASKFVVTYFHAYRWTGTPPGTDYITFQVIFYANGDIKIQYNDAESVAPPTVFLNEGDVGIQNATGSAGVQYRVDGVGGPMFSSPLALQFGTNPNAFGGLKANVKVFLQGPYNAVTHLMDNTLKTSGTLAAHFGAIPIPSNAVDSINVEIRDAPTSGGSTIRQFQPAWLLTDGSIVSFADTTKGYASYASAASGNYYIVIWHRNHLAIMSAAAQALSTTLPTAYNFSTAQTQAFGTNPMIQVGTSPNVFAMYAGDANGSTIVTTSDANGVFGALLAAGYNPNDINLSGVVSTADANIIFANLLIGSQVSRPGQIKEEIVPIVGKKSTVLPKNATKEHN